MDEKDRRDGANGRIDLGDMTFGEFATLQDRERREQQAQANARFGDAVVARLGLPEPGGRNPNMVQAQASRQPARPQSVEREMKDRRAELENRPLGEAAFERAQGMHAGRFGRELPDNRQSPFQAFEAAQGHHAFGLPRKPTLAESYRDAIAHRESLGFPGSGYGATNAKALGRYQLTPVALEQIGWRDRGGNWSQKPFAGNHSDQWPDGKLRKVSSDAEFLRDPEAQERAMILYTADNLRQLRALGALRVIGTPINGKLARFRVSQAGLAAAAHRQGPGAVMNYLAFQRNGGWTANASRLTKDLRELYESVETRLREFENVEIDSYEN